VTSRPLVLVLASASPARRATLEAAGITPRIAVSAVDEAAVVARYGLTEPVDVALALARAKAEDVSGLVPQAEDPPVGRDAALVLGCDSVPGTRR